MHDSGKQFSLNTSQQCCSIFEKYCRGSFSYRFPNCSLIWSSLSLLLRCHDLTCTIYRGLFDDNYYIMGSWQNICLLGIHKTLTRPQVCSWAMACCSSSLWDLIKCHFKVSQIIMFLVKLWTIKTSVTCMWRKKCLESHCDLCACGTQMFWALLFPPSLF